MLQATSCQQCGSTTDAQSLDGLCGRCLATVGFSPEDLNERTAAQNVAALDKTIVLDSETLLRETKPSSRFGDYELISEIARGGMGVVYKARQVSLNRIVAVKMILNARFNNPEYVRRFRAEAEAAANLRHPNIVAIYEIGEKEGQHYFSMEYVEGRDLASLVHEQPLPPQRAAEHVRKIAEAMQYAHQHGILHRDLKPSNVLVDLEGEIRITDFGLAKRVAGLDGSSASSLGSSLGSASDLELTVSGQVLGSPSYMSPEQAAGKSRDVDVRSDVYALGAILYALVTGRPPFMADAIETTLLQVLRTEPVSPRLINPRVPKDLETICLKCLQKEPQRRYASAQEVADELEHFVRREPIRARPISAPAKAWRWCRRNPKLAAVTALAAIALLVISVGSPIAALHLNQARLVAEDRELKARRTAYAADMAVVQNAIEDGDYRHALQLLASHRPIGKQPDVRGWEFRYSWENCRSDELETIANCGETIPMGVRISNTGRWIVGREGRDANYAHVWDLAGRTEALGLKVEQREVAAAFSPDDRLFALGLSKAVKFWTTTTWREEPGALRHSNIVSFVQFLADGKRLATVAGTNLSIWDVSTRSLVETRVVPEGKHPVLSADAKTLAVTRSNQTVVLWREGHEVREWDSGHVQSGSHQVSLALSPDAHTLVAAVALRPGKDFTLRVWDVATGSLVTNLPAHRSFIASVAFSHAGDLLASAGFDKTVRLWDTRQWRQLTVLKGNLASVWSVAFVPGDERLVSWASDGALKLWPARPGRSSNEVVSLRAEFAIELVNEKLGALSVDGSAAAMLAGDGSGILVDTRRPEIAAEIRLPFRDANRVAVHGGGSLVAIARDSGVISLWDSQGQRHAGDLSMDRTQAVHVLRFSRDGRRLAARLLGRRIHLWDVPSLAELPAWKGRSLPAADFQFSPDGRTLACGEETGQISFWDVESGQALFALTGHSRRINRIAYSPDGMRLGSTSWDNTARAWDIGSRREIARVLGSSTGFFRVFFSPNGSRLCVAEYDNAVLLDIETKRPVAKLKTYAPVFVDDDSVLGVSDTELWRWHPPSIAAIDAMEDRVSSR